jgi:hypothetical protein
MSTTTDRRCRGRSDDDRDRCRWRRCADIVERTTVTAYDIDGDGVPDVIEHTTTTVYDIDGDGVPDLIESTTVTGVDVDGDGSFSEDELTIDRRSPSARTSSTRTTRRPDPDDQHCAEPGGSAALGDRAIDRARRSRR